MKRDKFYDNARGLGIFLLVFGHIFPYGSKVFAAIFSFHMPLFFIISGMLLNKHKERYVFDVCLKTGISYSFFLFVGLFLLFVRILLGDFTLYGGVRNFIVECIYHVGPDAGMVGSIWFLPILGISQIIALALLKMKARYFVKYRFYDVGILLLLSLVSIFIIAFIPNIFRVRTIFTTTLFVYLGLNWSSAIKKLVDSFRYKKIQLIILVPLWFYIALSNRTVNVAVPTYNNYVLFLLGALMGTYLVFLLSKFKFMNFSAFWGRNSLIIFATHGIWLYTLSMIEPNFNFTSQIQYNCFYTMASVAIIILCIPTYYVFKPLYSAYRNKLMIMLK